MMNCEHTSEARWERVGLGCMVVKLPNSVASKETTMERVVILLYHTTRIATIER